MPAVLHAVLFKTSRWSRSDAASWLATHNLKNDKVDTDDRYIQYTQEKLNALKKHGFTKITKETLPHGVVLVLASREDLQGGSLHVGDIQEFIKQSYLDAPNDHVGNFVLDQELSNAEVKVYQNPQTGQVVVANRGTKEALDWTNNAVYAASTSAYHLTPRYKSAVDIQKKAIKKYGKVDTNVGHSQGGIITRGLLSEGLTNEIINLNAASKGEAPQTWEYNIRSSMDPVSAMKGATQSVYGWFYPSTKKKNITIPAKTKDPLVEHSADILSRLPPTQVIGR
jgi:hypothetical protein